MSEPNEETKTLVTILRHVGIVRRNIKHFSQALDKRADVHDISKLSLEEFRGFVEVNQIARQHPFGSKEYKESLKDNDVIDLHFSRNSHHPEFYPNGIDDMSLLDVIEMICDWKAASETYGQTSFTDALVIQADRFKLDDKQQWLIALIAKELE